MERSVNIDTAPMDRPGLIARARKAAGFLFNHINVDPKAYHSSHFRDTTKSAEQAAPTQLVIEGMQRTEHGWNATGDYI